MSARKSFGPSLLFAILGWAISGWVTFTCPAFAQFKGDRELLKLRDPFKRPSIVRPGKEEARSELELIPVDRFKLVGVVTGPDRLRAMLAGPTGKTYFVAEKMKIGPRKGVIRRITQSSVQVRESIVNVLGEEESIDTELKLPDEVKEKTDVTGGW